MYIWPLLVSCRQMSVIVCHFSHHDLVLSLILIIIYILHFFFVLIVPGDGPSAAQYAKLHGQANKIYCKPKFLSHTELAEVNGLSEF